MQINEQKQNGIVEGVIYKQLLLFFFPILFGTLFQQLYTMVDAAIVGNFVGKEALAAVGGTTGTMINLLLGFFVGLASGAGVIISQYYGSKDERGVSQSVHTATALGVAGGFILMCAGLLLAPVLLRLMRVNGEVMGYALSYVRIYFLGMIPTALYNVGAGILRAIGDSRRPLYYLIAACAVNVVLDLLFVGVFHWGIEGAAVATVISQIGNMALTFRYLIRNRECYSVRPREVRFHTGELSKMLRLGIPSGMQAVLYAVSNMIIQSGINSFGTDSVAALTVFEKLDGIFWMIMSAFGIAVTTFIGQNFGARKYLRMKKAVRVSLGMAFGTAAALCVLCLIFVEPFYHAFTSDSAVIAIGVESVRFLMPMYITYVCIEVISGAMRGAGDGLIPMIITAVGVCVVRVAWVLLVVPFWHELNVLLLSYPISWSITSAVFLIYYKSEVWLRRCVRRSYGEEEIKNLQS